METWVLELRGNLRLNGSPLDDPEYIHCIYICCGNESTKLKISHVDLEVPWKHIILGLQIKRRWADRKDTHFLLTVYQKKLCTFSYFSFISPLLDCSVRTISNHQVEFLQFQKCHVVTRLRGIVRLVLSAWKALSEEANAFRKEKRLYLQGKFAREPRLWKDWLPKLKK